MFPEITPTTLQMQDTNVLCSSGVTLNFLSADWDAIDEIFSSSVGNYAVTSLSLEMRTWCKKKKKDIATAQSIVVSDRFEKRMVGLEIS